MNGHTSGFVLQESRACIGVTANIPSGSPPYSVVTITDFHDFTGVAPVKKPISLPHKRNLTGITAFLWAVQAVLRSWEAEWMRLLSQLHEKFEYRRVYPVYMDLKGVNAIFD